MILIRKINEMRKGQNYASVWEPEVPDDIFVKGTFIWFTTKTPMPAHLELNIIDLITNEGVVVPSAQPTV